MLDKFRSVAALAGLMQNKQKVSEAAQRIRAELAAIRAEGQAGGGAVRVVAGGDMTILDVRLEPPLAAGLAASDSAREHAQTLIRDAANDALRTAREAMRRVASREAEALGVAELMEDMGGLEQLLR